MKQGIFKILENTALKENVHKLVISGDTSGVTRAGMFINIKIDNCFLRRPVSVCDWDGDKITVIYKTVGRGTEILSAMQPGECLDVLTGLGNGFDLSLSGDKPLLIGGGLGLTPMYCLAKALIKEGRHVNVILGFNTADEVFYEEEFKALGASVTVCTVDGSYGIKGYVTEAMKGIDYSHFYTCGPEPMFKAIFKESRTSGQFSFEARMGCGFGACMGCSCKTVTGYKRICKDGPVLMKEEIIWAD